MSFDQALQVIERNGGKVEAESVTIKLKLLPQSVTKII